MSKVVVVGLGYVGLPLALLAARKGHEVTGLDVDTDKISKLTKKQSPFNDPLLQKEIQSTTVRFSADFNPIAKAEVIVICVPTPVTDRRLPDLRPLKSAVDSVGRHVKKHSLVIIESTVNPAVCDEVVIPLLESKSKLKVGKDLFVAHCPERISPGDLTWNLENINRVVGGDSETAVKKALAFYGSILSASVKPMASLKEAEAVKIVENTFRDINIAFVNELAMSFHKMGINLENVIDGASTKPFAFMAHHPSCGVGGHCIPVDPYYLIEHAKGYGFEHRFLKLAREINESMPDFTITLLEQAMAERGLKKRSAKVVVFGQTYKADIDDTRESPGVVIYEKLKQKGYRASRFDPFAPGHTDYPALNDALAAADSLIIAADHSAFKKLTPGRLRKAKVSVIIDGKNCLKNHKELLAGHLKYIGIGI